VDQDSAHHQIGDLLDKLLDPRSNFTVPTTPTLRPKLRKLLQSKAIAIENDLRATLRNVFTCTGLAPHYPRIGRPSVDPVLMLRMLLIG
jgi:hypothetical protein